MVILAVCGMGIGTGIVLQTNAEKAVRELGLDAEIEVTDLDAARTATSRSDLVLTSPDLARELGEVGVPVVVIDNFLDVAEIRERIAAATGHAPG
ncbi:PTS sugar transporter subunit IIB [Lipingzhangella sp. LS1_29]|uniref:PTS sugar transporter subunit IIB n=1 Tax=Lipingzhangella rawalii TaxID=2055835 RepID=A0ABU2H8S2_9ACTN|nr:PTS sugar transporter subunit IIB [Lipingzhangella rawalii]MDS1270994.1 PTS sugar transporter subunit IIB [Lipingzhangella rawalii]